MAFRLAPVAGDRVYGLLNIKLASLVVEGTSWMRPCSELSAVTLSYRLLPTSFAIKLWPIRIDFAPQHDGISPSPPGDYDAVLCDG